MASPAEIGQGLPDTLPEDFGDWDGESSPSTAPGNYGGSEAEDVSKPPAPPTPGPEVAPASLEDRFRSLTLPSPARVNADNGAFLHRPPRSPMAARLPNPVSQGEQTARPARESPFPSQQPKVS